MNIALWILQILLAAAFGMGGFMMLSTPVDELAAAIPWVARVPSWAPHLAGTTEVLGALGLVLPAATRTRPSLTPLAALGLVLVMLLAALWVHLPAGEWASVGTNAVLGLVASVKACPAYHLGTCRSSLLAEPGFSAPRSSRGSGGTVMPSRF